MKLGKHEKTTLIKKRTQRKGGSTKQPREPLRGSIDDYTDEELESLPLSEIAKLPECVVSPSLLFKRVTQGVNRRAAALQPKSNKRWGGYFG